MIVNALESEIRTFLLEKIRIEAVLLFAHPSQRKSGGEMHTGRGQLANIQLSRNSGKGEDIIIAVGHFVGDKFLMFLSDQIISALIDKQIALEGRLFVIGGNTRLKAAVGGLDVAVAVIDADDNGIIESIVAHKIHSVSFLPLCGNT